MSAEAAEALLRRICAREGLDWSAAREVRGGQINRVYTVEGAYALRVGEGPEAWARLSAEAALLRRLEGRVPVPRVLAIDRCGDAAYQVQALVQGRPLHHLWLDLGAGEKDGLVAELAACLRSLHEIAMPDYGPVLRPEGGASSWLECCDAAFRAAREGLERCGVALPQGLLRHLDEHWQRHRDSLTAEGACLVHGDVWPGNVLVHEGHVSALLDLELAMGAPADYELLLVEQFCLYPNDFAEEGREIYCTRHFADLAALLVRHYPELFAASRLRKRLDLYHLSYALEAYLHWVTHGGGRVGGGVPVSLVAKLANFLSGHGARIF